MCTSSTLTFTLLVVFFFIATNSFPSSAQQAEFYFDGFSEAAGADKNVTINGSAKLIKKGIIQLTNTTIHVMGHAFYSKKVQFKENGSVRSFSTAFTFASVPAFQQLGGHGYAFVISPSNTLNRAFDAQYLGLFNGSNVGNDTNHIFAVEFDEARDLEFKDINDNHVGVDINGLISNFSTPAGYYAENSTFTNMTLKDGNTIQTWIDFDSTNSILNVTISHSGSKPRLPLFSRKVNLSSVLNDYMYVGFSAATGQLASSHYLLGWSFNMTGQARTLPMTKVPKDSVAHSHMVLAITLSLSLSIVFVVFLAITFYLIRKKRNADIIEAWEKSTGPHRYSYSELKQATKGFREKELLGSGGFGRVYMGVLPKTKYLVAVKRVSHESKQGLREFIAEIATIGRLRHRNLVQLLGWCRRRGDFMLVYDYMPNKSLDKYLFDHPTLILDWEQRFKIVKGVASGLFYLHEGWEQVVIHRDIKASNILLDSELNGRVGDFGLARLHDHGSLLSTTRVVGTLGYLAPELPKSSKATTRTDVFAFGTLLLEVVCGRRPIEPKMSQDELVLVDWVWDQWDKERITSVVDPKLEGKYNVEEAVMVLKLGLMCSCRAPHLRPTMRQVVSYLEGELPLPDVLIPPSGAANVDGRNSNPFQSSSSFELASSGSWSKDGRSTDRRSTDEKKTGSNFPSRLVTW